MNSTPWQQIRNWNIIFSSRRKPHKIPIYTNNVFFCKEITNTGAWLSEGWNWSFYLRNLSFDVWFLLYLIWFFFWYLFFLGVEGCFSGFHMGFSGSWKFFESIWQRSWGFSRIWSLKSWTDEELKIFIEILYKGDIFIKILNKMYFREKSAWVT